ncbi:SPL family radical SAM protein [Paenibacillus nasutitermitis]|uniref:Radical SAM protein n=1 Tax=Paenibacillus nasutitermitis TaxID=1652958 RepID=A0A916YIX4_9BACL|nr:radical SAM protein [Paenibacillus nasutitermitis]GGD47918.1 radical SAM protein [Paenibacillus nasutitermitis]
MAQKTYEYATAKQTLNKVTAKSMPFEWSVNPYRGCAHGCSFCYARAFQSFIGRDAEDEFQNHITIKHNGAQALEVQLARNAKKFGGDLEAAANHIGQVTVGTATDPYQPIESKEMITRESLKVLAKYRISTSITTRSPLILRDLDLLQEMRISAVNISINTLRADITRKMEPASPFPAKRLETVETLERHGIRTGIFIAPILPCLTDASSDLEQLIAAARNHRASFAHASPLRLSPDVKAWYMHVLELHFPRLLPAYRTLFPGTGAYANRAYTDQLMEKVHNLLHNYGFTRQPLPRPERSAIQAVVQGAPGDRKSLQQPGNAVEQLEFSF